MKKNLILYYSLEGNTEFIATELNKLIDSDLIRIKPIKDINKDGFMKYIWGGKDVIMGKMPAIEELNININEYQNIFIGSPIWAGTFAPPIKTLLNMGLIRGKNIYYLYTHDGGHSRANH